jgi:hypothetical protein
MSSISSNHWLINRYKDITQQLFKNNIMLINKHYLVLACVLLSSLSICAQSTSDVVFVEDLKAEARVQLKRIMSDYDIDDWIFTDLVKIVHGEDARSYPILQMNTDHLDDDKLQLSVFIHENAHLFVANDAKDSAEDAAIAELKKLFPDAPAPDQKNLYHHIMVAWVTFDALVEIFGEEEARAIFERNINFYLEGNRESVLYQNYAWYNETAMNEAQKVGEVMVKYGFNINPDKGIVIK